jgi:hypothetical protein
MVGIDLAECGDGFFGETVSEIFALGIGAEILEGQDGERDARWTFCWSC